jgi:hypothetical protein
MLNEFAHHLYGTGFVRQATVEHDIGELVQHFTVRLTDDRCMRWTITDDELVMGGREVLGYWFEHIENDIRLALGADANEVRRRQNEVFMPMGPDIWPAPLFYLPRHSEEADRRASELFKLTAGPEAFATLNAGKPLPLEGSQGTAYTLHKRASYCVERVKDGAKLCAVVPGVPLWDHLLGIKLMVENDEPRFLKTANISAGREGRLTLTQAFIDEYAQTVDRALRASNPIRFR